MKKNDAAQKKMELRQEVARLRKMLDYEERVHEILENAARGDVRSIPSFLPPKMKELLEELAMVDEEIARLEHEINSMQQKLIRDQNPSHTSKSEPLHDTNVSLLSPFHHSLGQERPSINAKWTHERALFFINQAIRGEYTSNSTSARSNEKMRRSTVGFDHKGGLTREVGLQEKMSRKSGMIEKTFSHKLPPKHPNTKSTEHEVEIPNSLPPNSFSESVPLEDIPQTCQPNKLSENIMKCLICIFVRLIRTSRSMELERSGVLARSTNLSPVSRSLRSENGLNSKVNLSVSREMSQQDPYEILTLENSLPRDFGPYKNFVKFTSSSLDVKNISTSIPLLNKLRVLLENLNSVDLRFLTHHQKLAFWINMYNACVMHGFLQYGLPTNPEKVLSQLNKAVLNIGGKKLSALAIGHFILRQPNIIGEDQWNGEGDRKDLVRSVYELEHPEPNVPFALSVGSKSSPAVRIYTADTVSAELEKSKLEYLQASIVVTTTKKLMIPTFLSWNMHNFAKDVDSLLQWICNQLPTSGSLRKSMVDCLRQKNSEKMSDIIDFIPYDFEFQYLLAA